MRRPDRADHRCPRCRMHQTLCLCAELPRLETRTRVVLLMHQLEARKTTNTGRIASLCLADSRVVIRGRGDGAPAGGAGDPGAPLWGPDSDPVLLFPDDDARPITAWRQSARPITLIVPDGTWSQCTRVRRRVAGLAPVPCAALPVASVQDAAPFRLRHDRRPGRLSTLAAIAIALGLLEGPTVQQALERVLAMMVDRTLWTNGRIKTADVTGGIPDGVASHDPRRRRWCGGV